MQSAKHREQERFIRFEAVPDGAHPDHPDTERAALIRAFERLEAQLDRVEGQVHKVESHFHQHVLRLVGNHSDLVKLSTQILDQLGGSAAQVDSHPPRPQKRIPRSGSKRQKAA